MAIGIAAKAKFQRAFWSFEYFDGAYFWADGMTPRKSDGLIWERSDLVGDGTHPSDTGRQKVAEQLLNFFKTDVRAQTWFVKK